MPNHSRAAKPSTSTRTPSATTSAGSSRDRAHQSADGAIAVQQPLQEVISLRGSKRLDRQDVHEGCGKPPIGARTPP